MVNPIRTLRVWESKRQPELREFKNDTATALRNVVGFGLLISVGSYFGVNFVPVEWASIVFSVAVIVIFLIYTLLKLAWIGERYYYDVQP